MGGPLAGIRVIDLSAMLSGPLAADILGDQGADVIKVEPPGTGDHVRALRNREQGLASMFVNVNRSKRSVTLDLKQPDGVALLKSLVTTADVLVQNFRPGVVERLGIGHEDLAAVNPRLVYLSISGFGETGPYADRRVYDPIVQALSGLTTVQAGSDAARPRLIRTVLPDKLTAMAGAQAISAALVARSRTGEGQHIRLSMLDTVVSFLWATDMNAYTFADRTLEPERAASFIDLILESATVRGRDQVVVQRYVPEVAAGDRRVIVLDGAPLGVVRRVATEGEFRCNMAAGASVVADTVTPRDKEVCARMADQLAEHGLAFVGIDLIGEYLTEINVTSPTGVREIDAFAGTRLSDHVIASVERRAAARA